MYVERILEEKKRLNLSVRTISDMSTPHVNEDTVTRILSRKTNDPGVQTVEAVASAVGLKLYEVFMDETLAAEFRAFLEFKNRSDESEIERVKITAENEELQKTNAGLADRLRVLEMENAHQKEKIKLIEDKLDLAEELLGIYRPEKSAPKFLMLD